MLTKRSVAPLLILVLSGMISARLFFIGAVIGEEPAVPVDVRATPPLITQTEFHDNFDLTGEYTTHLHRVTNMKVWNEKPNGLDVRYWGPVRSGVEGELILHYQFERPLAEASLAANLLPHTATDLVVIEISTDDEHYYLLTDERQHPTTDAPHSLTRLNCTDHVAGRKHVYLRIRLRGTQLNTSIMSAQFLRTAADMPMFQAPHVYDFRAKMRN
jgi:hypothetical protein